MQNNHDEIQVSIKQVYGIERVYPVCEKAKALARLTGNLTLTPEAIQSVKELGFKIVVVNLKKEL